MMLLMMMMMIRMFYFHKWANSIKNSFNDARFQASAAKLMRTAVFGAVSRRVVLNH